MSRWENDQQAQAHTKQLVQQLRFSMLGKRQNQIAEALGMGPRGWRYVRDGDKKFSESSVSRLEVMLWVHRPSPALLVNSPLANLVDLSIKRAHNIEDLFESDKWIDKLLESDIEAAIQDYGVLGLSAAVAFGIWRLDSDFKTARYAPISYLEKAERRWKQAADIAPYLASQTFAINQRTARIYRDTFHKYGGRAQPDKEHHEAYRQYAVLTGQVQAWRDALEQATLLQDAEHINQAFSCIMKAAENAVLTVKDQYEVLIPELKQIDGFSALEREAVYQQWVTSVTENYQNEFSALKEVA